MIKRNIFCILVLISLTAPGLSGMKRSPEARRRKPSSSCLARLLEYIVGGKPTPKKPIIRDEPLPDEPPNTAPAESALPAELVPSTDPFITEGPWREPEGPPPWEEPALPRDSIQRQIDKFHTTLRDDPPSTPDAIKLQLSMIYTILYSRKKTPLGHQFVVLRLLTDHYLELLIELDQSTDKFKEDTRE